MRTSVDVEVDNQAQIEHCRRRAVEIDAVGEAERLHQRGIDGVVADQIHRDLHLPGEVPSVGGVGEFATERAENDATTEPLPKSDRRLYLSS